MREKLERYGALLPNKPVFLTLSSEELIYYYNIADLYVHAASVEIEGMTILESMACGLPLLLADSPKSAARQFALDQTSLYKFDEVPDLVKKMDYWVENPDKLKEARVQYAEHSMNYRIESSYQELVDHYRRLKTEDRGLKTDTLSSISPLREK